MNINYTLVGLVSLLVVCLLVFLIVRNRKDRKKFEEEVNQSDVPPEQHEDESGRI